MTNARIGNEIEDGFARIAIQMGGTQSRSCAGRSRLDRAVAVISVLLS